MNDTSIFTNRMTNVPLDHKPSLNITTEVSNDSTSYLKDNLQTAIEQSEIFGDFEVSESILSGTACDSSSKLSEKQEGSKEFVKMADLKSNSANVLSNLSSETSDILKKGNENIESNYDSTTDGTTQDTDSTDKLIQEEKNSDSRVKDLQAFQENNHNDKTLQQASVLTQKEKLNGIHNGKESTSTNEDKMEIQTSDYHTSLLQEDDSSIPRKQTSQLSASEVLEENFCIKRFEKALVPPLQGSKEDSASNDSVSIISIESTDNCSADGSNSSQEDDKNIKENLSCQDVDSPVNDTEEEMKEHTHLEERISSGVQDQVVSSSEFLPARFSALQESDMESDSIVSINNEDLVPQYNKTDDNSNSGSSVTESETENISNESSSSNSTGVSDSENTESSREKSSTGISDSDERTDAVPTNNTNNHKDDINDKLLSLEKQDENLELKKNTSGLKEKCDDSVVEDDIHQIMNKKSKNGQRLIAQDVNYNSEPYMAEAEKEDQDMKSVSCASNSDCDMFEDNDEAMKNTTDDELTKSKTRDQLIINKTDEGKYSNILKIDDQRLHRAEASPGENLVPSHESQISIKVNKEQIDSLILFEGSKNIEDLQTIDESYQSALNESREDESNNSQSSSCSVKIEKSNDSNIKFDDVLSCNDIKANIDVKNITESNLTSSTESLLCTTSTIESIKTGVTKTENSEIFVKLDDMKCTSDQVCHKRNRNDMNTELDSIEGQSSEKYTESKPHSNESVAESDLSKTSKEVQEKVLNKCDKKISEISSLRNSKSLSENLSSQTVKYSLKACKVNLSDSKVSENVVLKASRDLLLDKSNFYKLKRKLEDMIQTAQLEEEEATQQVKKMREEKSLILKDIVFQIKNVKKKYSI